MGNACAQRGSLQISDATSEVKVLTKASASGPQKEPGFVHTVAAPHPSPTYPNSTNVGEGVEVNENGHERHSQPALNAAVAAATEDNIVEGISKMKDQDEAEPLPTLPAAQPGSDTHAPARLHVASIVIGPEDVSVDVAGEGGPLSGPVKALRAPEGGAVLVSRLDRDQPLPRARDEEASEGYQSGLESEDEDEPVIMSQLKLTKPAPEFSGPAVVDGEFKDISLSQYKGKYVVFFFYPLDFTFVCPTEIIAFSDRVDEFKAINCEVIGCSTDSHFSHLAWINTPRKQGGLGEMKIPLLADKTCSIAKTYGVYKEDDGIAFRGLFIIDDKGNLRQMTVNDLPVGRSVDETLRLVQAFQFTDKHGEVCPAGWKPGAATMKPDPKESKAYFQKNN